MVDAALGSKRTCPSCASRFYDLDKHPINCPHCDETFVVEPILPSKADSQAAPAPVAEAPKPVEIAPAPAPAPDDDDTDDTVDDEVAAIKDVDLGEEADDATPAENDNTFLETDDDEEANVTDIVAPGPAGNEET